MRSKLNSLCAKMKLNKTNNQQKTPPTTLLYSTTKTTTTSTTTTHTNQIKNKKNSQPLLHTLTPVYAMKTLHFYRTPPKKTTHNYNDKDDVPGKVDEKATQLHAIASLKVLLDATKPQRGGATTSAANHVKINLKETTLADRPNGNIDTTLDSVS